jgi:hypothetical protein
LPALVGAPAVEELPVFVEVPALAGGAAAGGAAGADGAGDSASACVAAGVFVAASWLGADAAVSVKVSSDAVDVVLDSFDKDESNSDGGVMALSMSLRRSSIGLIFA